VVLGSDGAELALHAIPAQIAAQIAIEDPPQAREDTALKLVFAVSELDQLRASAEQFGGAMKEPRTIGSRRICDGVDPEGNVFQLSQA
jgi:predicted enzyme related to lactoylglutathione lyase